MSPSLTSISMLTEPNGRGAEVRRVTLLGFPLGTAQV
jgi:hypothetical protein